jgi:alpha-glucosidase (family GH31 glycosyl hydrolase)
MYDTGLSFLRPLYYEFPNEKMAYECLTADGDFSQYMLGDNLMIAPIVSKLDSSNHLIMDKKIWVPPGSWVNY